MVKSIIGGDKYGEYDQLMNTIENLNRRKLQDLISFIVMESCHALGIKKNTEEIFYTGKKDTKYNRLYGMTLAEMAKRADMSIVTIHAHLQIPGCRQRILRKLGIKNK